MPDRISQLLRAADRHQQSLNTVCQYRGYPPCCCGDDRQTHGHRFQHGQRCAFVLRAENKDRCTSQYRCDISDGAKHSDERVPSPHLSEDTLLTSSTDDVAGHPKPVGIQDPQGQDKILLALYGGEPSHGDDTEFIISRGRGWSENCKVDTPGHNRASIDPSLCPEPSRELIRDANDLVDTPRNASPNAQSDRPHRSRPGMHRCNNSASALRPKVSGKGGIEERGLVMGVDNSNAH